MWTRGDLKTRAKESLKKTYWTALLMTFLFSLISGRGSYTFNMPQNFTNLFASPGSSQDMFHLGRLDSRIVAAIMIVIVVAAVVFVIGLAIAAVMYYFLIGPFHVGVSRFFIMNAAYDCKISHFGYVFNKQWYKNVCKGMFMMTVRVWLWHLLFIIPGIIKTYEYFFVPYILAENPEMHYEQALALSRQMTDGQKWSIFVLQLSFIGWNLLGFLCCCIGVHFVVPYVQATNAELYLASKNRIA